MHFTSPRLRSLLVLVAAGWLLASTAPVQAGVWAFSQGPHPTQTGEVIDITEDGGLVARFVHGEGQPKPYLHVFENGVQLTKGDSGGVYPHHRGIFIGWDHIVSGGKTSDLWHLDDQSTIRVVAIDHVWANADSVTLIARIEWKGSAASGKVLLIDETRTLHISRPNGNRTQVDAFFQLRAARDLTLDGDRQHVSAVCIFVPRRKSMIARGKPRISPPRKATTDFTFWTPVTSPAFTFPSPGVARWSDPTIQCPLQRFYRLGVEMSSFALAADKCEARRQRQTTKRRQLTR